MVIFNVNKVYGVYINYHQKHSCRPSNGIQWHKVPLYLFKYNNHPNQSPTCSISGQRLSTSAYIGGLGVVKLFGRLGG